MASMSSFSYPPSSFDKVMIFVDGTNFLEDLNEFREGNTNVAVKDKRLNFSDFLGILGMVES